MIKKRKSVLKNAIRLLEIYKKKVNDTYNIDGNIEIRFAHIKKDGSKVNYDKIKEGDDNGTSNIDDLGNCITYLKLDRYDFDGKFRAGMVWFTMAHELSHSFVGM